MERSSKQSIYRRSCNFLTFFWLIASEFHVMIKLAAGESTNEEFSSSKLLGLLPDTPNPWQFLNLEAGVWSEFKSLINARKGDSSDVIAHLKQYFAQFGYLSLPEGMMVSGDFDDAAEAAIRLYQDWFGLPITGMLDLPTLNQLIQPRCGRADVVDQSFSSVLKDDQIFKKKKTSSSTGRVKHFSFFPGNPTWKTKQQLTYAFSPSMETSRVTLHARRSAFENAFSRWSAAVPLNFSEVSSYDDADVKIEFADGDHSDGQPFDGVLGILAHAFSPEDGRFHLDNAEYWTSNMKTEKSSLAMDLESVAAHEIGHLIGLAHSSTKDAIMFPSLSPRQLKRQLDADDIQGAQALYGSSKSFQAGNTDSSTVQNTIKTSNGVSRSFSCNLWHLICILMTIRILSSVPRCYRIS